jgi:micrococcal nuclease
MTHQRHRVVLAQTTSSTSSWIFVYFAILGLITRSTTVDAFHLHSNPTWRTSRRATNPPFPSVHSLNNLHLLPSSDTSIRLRGGGLSAARRAASSPSLQAKFWNYPITKTVVSVLASIWRILHSELNNLSIKQRWMMLGIFVLGVQMGRSLSSLVFRPFKDVADIPSRFFGPQAPYLTGTAVSVSDGDTLRFLHKPTPFHPSSLGKNQKLSTSTLPIRICTIDTPETSKFGKPGQPFGEEAKRRLQSLAENRTVHVRLLTKDQYGRAVGQVVVPRMFGLSRQAVDEIMLKEGLAEVYQGMGAVYGEKGKDVYVAMEEHARKSKNGIWSQAQRESASEYKKRTK